MSSGAARAILRRVEDAARVELVQRYWTQAWSQGQVAVLEDFYAPTFRENEQALTPAEFARHLLAWREKFPDFRAEVDRLFLSPGVVVSRVLYSGTHRGDFSFLPATGRSVRSSGLDVFEFGADGKVVQHWHETDHWELFEQLGLQVAAR